MESTDLEKFFGTDSLLGHPSSVPVSSLSQKDYILLYFSASWCPPCRSFTPQLIDFYHRHKDSKNFEILLFSWDRDPIAFETYFSKMPWPALRRGGVNLAHVFGVTSIPTLIVLDAKTLQVMSHQGRIAVMRDSNAEKFPWKGIDYPLIPKFVIYGSILIIIALIYFIFFRY